MNNLRRCGILAAVTAVALAAAPRAADAFCGFYVSGSGEPMFNDATEVVLMRMGTRTVLSMQNNYQGPLDAFALVVPVPVVLQEGDVKTLPKEVFAKVDLMGSPRLVEYWEQDPCKPMPVEEQMVPAPSGMAVDKADAAKRSDLGVTIEAQFVVGEYQIVILSAKDSTGLDTWLRQEHYQIPANAQSLLDPYVVAGSKFFVAKVDPAKVTFEGNHALLSPLRFHYDSDDFALPIRLGMANSNGTQDLIVNILSPNQRFVAANYPNVTIPTNLDVKDAVKGHFAEFYAALFDQTLVKTPGAVVTEYAWQAVGCDPCPGPQLDYHDFATLGADVLLGERGKPEAYGGSDFVLTRLHARYGTDVKDDLVFAAAAPIFGGREQAAAGGTLEQGARTSDYNNFQARYAIRHPWTGPLTCKDPVRGRWGGPPPELQIAVSPSKTDAATNLAYAPRGAMKLPDVVTRDIPEIDLKLASKVTDQPPVAPAAATGSPTAAPTPPAEKKRGCGCQTEDADSTAIGLVLVLGAIMLRRRRRA